MYTIRATDLYQELWIAVGKLCTWVALHSSCIACCIYAMGWTELYSHSSIGKVLNVAVLQNVSKADVGVGRSLFVLRAVGVHSSVPVVTKSHHGDLRWENGLPPSPMPFCWSCSAGSSHASVTNLFALGMWAQLSPKAAISSPPLTVSANFPEQSERKKGRGEHQQLRLGNHNRISQDKEKALLQIWNFIPDQFHRATPEIQLSELPNNNYQVKKQLQCFSAQKILDNLSRELIAVYPCNVENKHINILLVKVSF